MQRFKDVQYVRDGEFPNTWQGQELNGVSKFKSILSDIGWYIGKYWFPTLLVLIFAGMFIGIIGGPFTDTNSVEVDGQIVSTICKKWTWFGTKDCVIIETGLVRP